MWFNDTLNLQDIVDTDVNKMLEKQKMVNKILERLDIDTSIEGESYFEDISVPSDKHQYIKLWTNTIIDTFVYLRTLSNDLLLNSDSINLLDKVINLKTLKLKDKT